MADYDLIVIGGGSGGVRAARIAASHGARVAICESHRYGGTCVIRGCVPKKLMVYASHFHEDFSDSKAYGWTVAQASFNWQTLIANKDKEIDRLNGIYEKLLHTAGVEIFHGHGRLLDQNTVEINNQKAAAETLLIATGGKPFIPDVGFKEQVITSNEVFYLKQQPRRIAVVGGGYIAVEFAGIFNGLGTQTSLLYRGPRILRGFDMDIRNHAHNELITKGISVELNASLNDVEIQPDGSKRIHLDDKTLDVDVILYATGRKPNIQNLGLENVGVLLGNNGEIVVNDYSQTTIENIFAVGDVTNRIALTPVATMEGHAFADHHFGGMTHRIADHQNVPSAVFSQPPIASVGLNEESAREKYSDIKVYTSEFRTLKHTLTENQERVLIKLIVEAKTDRVIGAHMMGADASEIMQGIAIAIKAGAKKADFDATVGIHPSSAEEFCTLRTPREG